MINKDDSVNTLGLHYKMRPVFIYADEIWKDLGETCVCTSAIDGKHSKYSLHYFGCAVDFRTRYFTEMQKLTAERYLKEKLGKDYDVVLEKDHMHVEYDPK